MMKYVLGNWKMNMSVDRIRDFDANFVTENTPDIMLGLAVPSIYLGCSIGLNDRASVGLQNVSEFEHGAYTGEISAAMAQDMAADFCLVGHSERRKYYGETDAVVNQKISRLIEAGIRPVLCIGETLAEYEAGETKVVLQRQITNALKGIDLSGLIVAYEPVWAIGTGKSASTEIIDEVCGFVSECLSNMGGSEVPILYGGSVNSTNATDIARLDTVDGVLVGGASMDASEFLAIKKAFC